MVEIELSVMAQTADDFRPLLDQFEAQQHIRVRVRIFDWATAWPELVDLAVHGRGPDVSEIGTTWINNLAAMDVMRPFSDRDIVSLGGAAIFPTSVWQSAGQLEGKRVWSIPWFVDMPVIYYRRDLLQKAGVDENTAFQTSAQLEQTLERLRASGVAIPWVYPTQPTLSTLHYLASWIWEAGGDFLDDTSSQVILDQPKIHQSLRAYFSLVRYLSPQTFAFDENQVNKIFMSGQAAVTLAGMWAWLDVLEGKATAAPEVMENIGFAQVLGVPYVGGANLVIWRHTPRIEAAQKLVRYLVSRQVQATYPQRVGFLPIRQDMLAEPAFASQALYRMVSQGLAASRTLPTVSTWGMIEERLSLAFSAVWQSILADPKHDVDAALADQLISAVKRLNFTLKSRPQNKW